MYKVSADENVFEIVPSKSGFTVNGRLVEWDFVTIEDGYFHVIWQNKSYRAEVVKAEKESKTFTIKINNRSYTVQLRDKFDLLLEKMGMNNGQSGKINTIKAPMPGLIVDVRVKEGDTVKANDPLLILEAMKMENMIKSPGDAVVKSIKVRKGDNVEKNQVLIEF